MNRTYNAEIISIGTELLLGEILDSNATFIAGRLRDLGISVYRKTTVGDNLQRLSGIIREALDRSDVVILGGGLGPTDDDLTREAIAAVVGETPLVEADLLEGLKQMFARRGRPMAKSNEKQAWLIPSATALPNPFGTACGWMVRHNSRLIFALPGPPSEMKKMWVDQVEPRLPVSHKCLYGRTIHTSGIGESDLVEKIKDFTSLAEPGIGTYARNHGVDIRIAAMSDSPARAKQIVDPVLAKVEAVVQPWIFGYDDETLVSAIKKQLNNRRQSFSCIESLTGGQLAAEITRCAGISSCFKGSVTAYASEMKVMAGVAEELISQHGAVSEEVVVDMARACRKMFATDWALATTGVAGPDAIEGKEPGTAWIAVAGPDGVESMLLDWPGDREMVINRVCRSVLQKFYQLIKE